MFRRDFLKVSGAGLASSVVGLPTLAKEIEKPKPLSTGYKELDDILLQTDEEKLIIRITCSDSYEYYLKAFLDNLGQNNDAPLISIINHSHTKSSLHTSCDKNLLTAKYNFVVCKICVDFIQNTDICLYIFPGTIDVENYQTKESFLIKT